MERNLKVGTVLSILYVIAAICLLLNVCLFCYPNAKYELREVLLGEKDGYLQTAFSVLADGLENGAPVGETVMEAFSCLTGHGD